MSIEDEKDRIVNHAMTSLGFTAPELINEKTERFLRAAFERGAAAWQESQQNRKVVAVDIDKLTVTYRCESEDEAREHARTMARQLGALCPRCVGRGA